MMDFFTDPILRAPILGCMFMCLAASMMGVVVFLKKRSLLGEALSHAAYPGVIAGVLVCSLFAQEEFLLFALLGAFLFSLFGLKAIDWLQRHKVKNDAALCFVLASFFGLGILGASWLQGVDPQLCRQAQTYLYGQVATMMDIHVIAYGSLSLIAALFLFLFYRPLQAQLFDSAFSASAALVPRGFAGMLTALLLLSVIIGIRSVGVVLMSGMLIAPAVAARQFTDKLSYLFCLSALFGVLSALCGALVSIKANLPTGPMIVLFGTLFALFSLLFAPKRGMASRYLRILRFRLRCVEENILKAIWKKKTLTFSCLQQHHHLKTPILFLQLRWMERHGWLIRAQKHYTLSPDGVARAARIVRLHRLWEVYLASQGWPGGQIHRSAEEMEHILTSELEERLSKELSHPTLDPHEQPIPEKAP